MANNSSKSRPSEGSARKSDTKSKSLNSSKKNPPSDESDAEFDKIPLKAIKIFAKKSKGFQLGLESSFYFDLDLKAINILFANINEL